MGGQDIRSMQVQREGLDMETRFTSRACLQRTLCRCQACANGGHCRWSLRWCVRWSTSWPLGLPLTSCQLTYHVADSGTLGRAVESVVDAEPLTTGDSLLFGSPHDPVNKKTYNSES